MSEIRHCATCHAPIVWLRARSGKNMPVNAATTQVGDTAFDPTRHVSHFATCPDAAHHRRQPDAQH